MRKTLIAIVISITMVAGVMGCRTLYTPDELRDTQPLVTREILKSPEKVIYCIVSLMDERMLVGSTGTVRFAMTNHVRLRDNSASVVSFSGGGMFGGAPILLFVVEAKATSTGSLVTFHRDPYAVFSDVGLVREMSQIFEDCAKS